jgi:hypothetical protein
LAGVLLSIGFLILMAVPQAKQIIEYPAQFVQLNQLELQVDSVMDLEETSNEAPVSKESDSTGLQTEQQMLID